MSSSTNIRNSNGSNSNSNSVIKFEKILSCTSEHTLYPSINLITGEEGWKSDKSGLDQISVVIKLKKEAFINWIEIGNDFSAFVEVWVSKDENTSDSEFEVLLSPSSFMTPNESKNESNINRVRCFEQDKLSSSTLKKKWDLIKIICSQPFNKTVNYGIRFIRLKESESPPTSDSPNPLSSINLGSFSLKIIDSDASNDLSVGSYFLKHQNQSEIDVEHLLSHKKSVDDEKTTVSPLKKKQRSLTPKISTQNNVDRNQANLSPIPSTTSPPAQRESLTDPKKKKHSPITTAKSSCENEPFNKILSHVVFAISGFQNPKRSEIRNKGLEMGAKYKSDWEASCTHLICAFPNTPKYNHVKNLNGIIVTKEWIEDCYKQKRLIPFKYYQLNSSKKRHSESEDSDDTLDYQKAEKEEDEGDEEVQKLKKQVRKRKRTTVYFETDDEEEKDNDDDDKEKSSKTPEDDMDSDEIYNLSTEDESFEYLKILEGQKFYLYGDFENKDYIIKCITKYGGEVKNDTNDVNIVISSNHWNETFDKAFNNVPSIRFLTPQWILDVTKEEKIIDFKEYLIHPPVKID